MNKAQFNTTLASSLSPEEIILINPNIYLNPEHLDYYINYHSEEYDKCWKYLMKHRHLLSIKHTPNGVRGMAKDMLKSLKNPAVKRQLMEAMMNMV